MQKAFTLIELLVVVLIIGILAAVALPQYQKAVEKARMTEAIIAVEKIAQAQQIFKLANGKFTRDITELDVDFPGEPFDYGGYPGIKTKYFQLLASNMVGEQAYIALVRKSKHYSLLKTPSGGRGCGIDEDVTEYEQKLCQEWAAGN